jgi:hypothetical protein
VSDLPRNAEGFHVDGWRIDLEDIDAINALGSDIRDWQDAVSGLYATPKAISYPWLRIENQGQQGACQGFALSSAAEVCHYIATQGKVVQLSPQWAYIESQRFDGLIGYDRGSTLTGGLKVAMQLGLCRDELWPYTGRYHTESPKGRAACLADAAGFKLQKGIRLKNAQQVKDWIAGGVGAAWCGRRIGWGGGHATLFAELDEQGRFVEVNSWGGNWGNRGRATHTFQTVQGWFSDPYTVFVGVSDMQTIAVRPVDFSKETIFKD